jgi:hypothetical protein
MNQLTPEAEAWIDKECSDITSRLHRKICRQLLRKALTDPALLKAQRLYTAEEYNNLIRAFEAQIKAITSPPQNS